MGHSHDFVNFDLSIEDRGSGKLKATVVDSPAGEAYCEFDWPFSHREVVDVLLAFGARRPTMRRVDPPRLQHVRDFARRLHDAIFSDAVGDCLLRSLDDVERRGVGLRIRLRLGQAGEYVDIPWELLYSDSRGRFLATSTKTPIVRYIQLGRPTPALEVQPPLRILVVVSSPSDQVALDVDGEWQRIIDALGHLQTTGHLAVDRLSSATFPELQSALRAERYHIIHFVGHGGFDEAAQQGVLYFEDDSGTHRAVSAEQLGMLLHDHDTLRLVMLNACEGARTSSTDPFSGTAQDLLRQGVPAVVAMQFSISDTAALLFANAFYGSLADGYPVDASVGEGRKAIFGDDNLLEWSTPVLFLRSPDGQIFDVDTSGIPPAQPQVPLDSEPHEPDTEPHEPDTEPHEPDPEPHEPDSEGERPADVTTVPIPVPDEPAEALGNGGGSAPPPPPPPPSVADRTERILQAAAPLADTVDFHVRPDISAKVQANVRQHCAVPDDEDVLAVADCTVWGSAKRALVFGARALYHSNYSDPISLGYDELGAATVSTTSDAVLVGPSALLVSGCTVSGDDIIGVLRAAGIVVSEDRTDPPEAAEPAAELAEIVRRFTELDDFYVAPDVPEKKLRNAMAATGAPDEETVLGLLDCTIFGSAKDALLICATGLYYNHMNAEGVDAHLPWVSIDPLEVSVVSDGLVSRKLRIGNSIYDVGGSNAPVSEIRRMVAMLAERATTSS